MTLLSVVCSVVLCSSYKTQQRVLKQVRISVPSHCNIAISPMQRQSKPRERLAVLTTCCYCCVFNGKSLCSIAMQHPRASIALAGQMCNRHICCRRNRASYCEIIAIWCCWYWSFVRVHWCVDSICRSPESEAGPLRTWSKRSAAALAFTNIYYTASNGNYRHFKWY